MILTHEKAHAAAGAGASPGTSSTTPAAAPVGNLLDFGSSKEAAKAAKSRGTASDGVMNSLGDLFGSQSSLVSNPTPNTNPNPNTGFRLHNLSTP
jgi:hypothetical protein